MAETNALLVIDIQNDFCEGGALAVPQGSEIVQKVNVLMPDFEIIVFSQDWHPANHHSFASNHANADPYSLINMPYGPQVLWPDHCIQGSEGAAFHPDLDQSRTQMIVRKGFRPHIDSYSAFFENDQKTPTGLDGYLRERGVKKITVVGLALDFCVQYTALDARNLGYEVTVLQGACRAIDLDGSLKNALELMSAAGISLE